MANAKLLDRLERLGIKELQNVLDKKMERLHNLKEQRRTLSKQLKGIDKEIAQMNVGPKKPAGKKGKGRRSKASSNDRPLKDYIKQVLTENGSVMRPREIRDAVFAAGYRSSSSNPQVIVNQTLMQLVKEGEIDRDKEAHTYQLAKK